MSKYLLALIASCFYSLTNAQNDDILVDADKKEIVTPKTDFKNYNVESLTDYFYKNISDVEEIDKIISFRFYQATPYKKFGELMESKNAQFGTFVSKEIIKIEYSDDKSKATVSVKVKYSKIESVEKIVFLKESKNDSYSIVEYAIQ